MAEAKDKAMWFGVDDGVRRYDGAKWTAYTEKDGLVGAPVYALCTARDGAVYAGTGWGISRFTDGKWSRVFPPEGDPSTSSGQALPWPIDDLMEARDGSVWAGTGWGALRLGQEGATIYTTKEMGAALRTLASYVKLSIVPDTAAPARPYGEGIGVGVTAIPASMFRRGIPAVIYTLTPGGPGEAAGLKVGDRILAVNGDSSGLGQTVGPPGVVVRLTVQRKGHSKPLEVTVTRAKITGTYRSFGVYDVFEDRDGAIWFGLFQGEIIRCDPSTSSGQGIRNTRAGEAAWQLYTEKDGLDIDYGPRIIQTRDGVIWTVSYDIRGGVNRLDRKGWMHFRLSDLGGDNHNRSILETRDGTLWVGGNGGYLHAYRNGRWTIYRPPDIPIPGTYLIGLLEASDGALWMGSLGQEAVRLDYGTARWTTYTGLWFQCETPDGAQWFLSQDYGVVCYDGRRWTRYGVEDGLMDNPGRLIVTRQGALWAAGSLDSTAATARFDGRKWGSLQTHPRFSWNILPRMVYESSDGSLYFGAAGGPTSLERGYLGGLLRFNGKTWVHYTPPEVPRLIYGVGQTADGILWFGGPSGLGHFDGKVWTVVTGPEEMINSAVDAVYVTPKGDLYVGTRSYGVFRFDGKTWRQYDVRDGLTDNRITSIFQTDDGSVWVATDKGISRFDGRTWVAQALPPDLRQGPLRQSRDGALWGNSPSRTTYQPRETFRTTRYQPDTVPPATEITLSLDKVSQPGNTTLAWRGADPWKATPDEEVQYSYRLNGGEWSPFSHEKSHIFQALLSGDHTFEVKARDRDFNIDPTPAVMRFTVVPPVWRQPWFIALMALLLGTITFQASRIVVRDRRLRESNTALSDANKQLVAHAREAQVEAALERVRAKALGMQKSEDISQTAATVFRELTALGLPLRRSVIVTVDEERDTGESWVTTVKDEIQICARHPFPLNALKGHPVLRNAYDAWRRQETCYHWELEGDALTEYVRYLVEYLYFAMEHLSYPEQSIQLPDALPKRLHGYYAFSSHASLLAVTGEPLSDEDRGVVQRFAGVFSLAYTRFLDLQQAEAQARQAVRQAAVDRVRAEVAAMRTSADLERVTPLVWKELTALGVPFFRCGVFIADEEEGRIRSYLTNPQGESLAALSLAFDCHPFVSGVVDHWRKGEVYVEQWDPQAMLGWMQFLEGQGQPIEREQYLDGKALPESLVIQCVPFAQGMLYVGGAVPLPEEDIDLVKSLANAFSVAYARYQDFRRLEAQNRKLDESNRALSAANEQIQEANRLKSQFLASMSHELRTPMNAIIGFTNLVLRRGSEGLSERHRDNLTKVKLSADHLLNLINDILDLSKIEAGRVDIRAVRFDVRQLIASCCETVSPLVRPGVALGYEVSEEVGEAHTDEARLRQVVINLLSNALKFTEKGEVRVSVVRGPWSVVRENQATSQVGGEGTNHESRVTSHEFLTISVSDTGIGIPPDALGYIFDEFRQVEGGHQQQKGTGLGLSITKKLTELLGGTIEVESEVGKGSTFTVWIPFVYRERQGDEIRRGD